MIRSSLILLFSVFFSLFGQDLINKQPIFWLPMGNNYLSQIGISMDITGNGNHSANYGVTNSADRFGIVGNAYSFDGDDSITPSSLISFADNKPFTISFWYCTHDYGSYNAFFGYNNTDGKNTKLWIYPDGRVYLYGDYEATSSITGISLGNNTWNHIAWVCDGAITSNNILYINGINKGLRQLANSQITIQVIGNGGQSAYDIMGRLSDFRVYDYALTPGQVKSLNNESKGFDILNSSFNNIFQP